MQILYHQFIEQLYVQELIVLSWFNYIFKNVLECSAYEGEYEYEIWKKDEVS